MRKYAVKLLLRSIKGSLGRYLAILSIVALGVGFYSGLKSSEPAMRLTAADYMDRTAMYDFRLLSTLGFSKADEESVRSSAKVRNAEGAFFSEALADTAEGEEPLMFMSLTCRVSVPVLSAGRMPEIAGECLGDRALFSESDIGKTIRLSENNDEDTFDLFADHEFVITGLAGSPRYISVDRGSTSLGSGKLEGFVIVLPEAFDGEIYHELLVDCGLSGSFTDEYQNRADALKPEMEAMLNKVGSERYKELRAEADEELADARKELDDGWREYEDGKAEAEQEIADGWEEIESARNDLKMGESRLVASEKELNEGLAQLSEAEKKLDDNQALLDEKSAEIEAGEPQLAAAEQMAADGRAEFEAKKASTLSELESNESALTAQLFSIQDAIRQAESSESEEERAGLAALYVQLESCQNSLDQIRAAISAANESLAIEEQKLIAMENAVAKQRAELEAGKAEIEKGQAELDAGRAQIEENRKLLEDGQRQIREGRNSIAQGYIDLEKGIEELKEAEADVKAELADALAELEDGEREYADAVREADDKLSLELHCLGRDSNAGCATFRNDITIISAAARAFPIFFVLIAALVCVTTMTRMVNEERTQIGTLKATGFSPVQTASKYLLYSGSAALFGCASGFAIGVTVIPYVVWYAYTILYNYSALTLYVDASMIIRCLAVSVPGIMAVTALACRDELKERPAELIRPKAPPKGRRILLERAGSLWKRLSFLTKVMLRNAFRRPARVFMMIVGIGGCTALMIAGFGAEDSLAHVTDYQYGDIFHYDVTVFYDSDEYPSRESADEIWKGLVERSSVIWQGEAELTAPGGDSRSVKLRSAEAEEYADTVSFVSEGTELRYPEKGEILLTTGIADILDLKVGDRVTLSGDDIPAAELTVCGIAENYVAKYAYIAPESIGSPAPNTGLLTAGENAAAAAAAIRSCDGISYVSCAADEEAVMARSMSSIGLIIIMVVICSGALAFITVYNLTNINIMERVRDIATVKVLGFRKKETAKYVLNENLLLSFLGAAAGLPLGKLLHRFIMELIKVEYMSYDVRILPRSYAISFAATILFVLLINRFMHGRLEAVNMAESLKSVE